MRATVSLPAPTSRAVFRMPFPSAREARTAASFLAAIFGRPNGLPLLVPRWRALAMPDLTRSTMIDRSNSAKTPSLIGEVSENPLILFFYPLWGSRQSVEGASNP
jgi:hypothetical protein